LSSWNGICPYTKAYSVTPMDQMSDACNISSRIKDCYIMPPHRGYCLLVYDAVYSSPITGDSILLLWEPQNQVPFITTKLNYMPKYW
jgi:hypothetical protein